MILADRYTAAVNDSVYDAFFGCGLPYIFGAVYAVHRLIDTRAEIAAVNEAMNAPPITWIKWRGPMRFNACLEPCDNWNGPCVCGAWHKDGK